MNPRIMKLIAVFLVLMLGLGLTACGGEKANIPASSTNLQEAELEFGLGLDEDFEVEEELDEYPDRAISRAAEPILQNVVTKLDGTTIRSDAYLYRSLLSDTHKQAYDLIRAGLVEGKTEIPMTVPITKDDVKTIYRSVFYDSPDLFWVDGGYSYSYNNYGNITKVKPKYNALAQDIPGNRDKFEKAVSEALADMWSLQNATEQVKYAHDYLTHTTGYDLNAAYNQTAYSALVNKSSVCAGYSRAFQYMMQKMDIRCGFISGVAHNSQTTGAHAWNIVELNGEFYAMDVTWDDPIGGKDQYYYNYFNLTDTTMSSDHTRGDISVGLPAALGTEMSFSAAFGDSKYGTDFDGIQGNLPEGYGKASTAFIGATSGEDKTSGNPYLP